MDPGSIIILLIRLGLPFSILRFNIMGFLACMAIDGLHAPIVYGLNAYVFSYSGEVVEYQLFDKWLDIYFLAFAVRASQKWGDELNSRAMLWLWIVRLAGVILSSITGFRFFLFVFPNLLVNYFPLVAVLRRYRPGYVPHTPRQMLFVMAILLVPKLMLEYVLHVEMLGLAEALTKYTPLEFPAPTLWQSVFPCL